MQSSALSTASTEPADVAPAHDPAAPVSGETARMLKTLLGNLDGMVYRCRDDADWTMEFVSEGCRRLTGYDAADLLLNNRVSYESITHADDRRRVRSEIHNGLKLLGRFDCEYDYEPEHEGEPVVPWGRCGCSRGRALCM